MNENKNKINNPIFSLEKFLWTFTQTNLTCFISFDILKQKFESLIAGLSF